MALVPMKRRDRDPWSLLTNFHNEISRLFGYELGRFPSFKEEDFTPSVDVWDDKDNIYVEADIPGVEQKDINVNLKDNALTISAKKEEAKEEKKKNYYRAERYQGSFYRTMQLSSSVDESKIKANYKNGVLKLIFPKKEKEKAKEIKINVE